jgi:hypothetical protein
MSSDDAPSTAAAIAVRLLLFDFLRDLVISEAAAHVPVDAFHTTRYDLFI